MVKNQIKPNISIFDNQKPFVLKKIYQEKQNIFEHFPSAKT